MYQVAVSSESKRWLLIGDGSTFYYSNDITKLPKTSRYVAQADRIQIFDTKTESLESFCQSKKAKLRGTATEIEKFNRTLKSVFFALCWGGLGAFLGGPFGALIFCVIYWLFRGEVGFQEYSLKSAFENARKNHEEWGQFEVISAEKELEKTRRYEREAREHWDKFYKFRNLDSVDKLSGVEFESIVGEIYKTKGYKITFTPSTGDYGVDVIAELNNTKLAIQVKRYSRPVGVKAIQEVASGAQFYKADKAVVVTNSTFTDNAKKMSNKLKVQLVDRNSLVLLWPSAFPETAPPIFDLKEYEFKKAEITEYLRRLRFKNY